jgi:UDP:flavonoid glycosyltransferase YjiC (YdhE family)
VTARRRVLFFAETVTLAHLGRPVALAKALDPARFECVIAAGPRYRELVAGESIPFRDLDTITSEAFLGALAKGTPLYSFTTLRRYVEEDRRHIEAVRPDVVVGDFRLSLSASARLSKVPYVAIANAYWSPYARPEYDIPSHPTVNLFGVKLARIAFKATRRAAFAIHCLPMHRLRRHYGLPSLGFELGRVYTDADWTLFADVPELVPMSRLPAGGRARYLGPVQWSPAIVPPEWWDRVPGDRPLVYVTLGSSGASSALATVVDALAEAPCTALVASAGASLPRAPANVRVATYLPGDAAAARARLVICNGGSPTAHQALAAGVPVLGIASNLDQFLNMHYVVKAGAGECLRADSLAHDAVREAVARLLAEDRYRRAATSLAASFRRYDAGRILAGVIGEACGDPAGAREGVT